MNGVPSQEWANWYCLRVQGQRCGVKGCPCADVGGGWLAHQRFVSIRWWCTDGGRPEPHTREHVDRPAWAYDEDGYCVACGNGKWKAHNDWCEIAYLVDLAVDAGDPLYVKEGDDA